MIGAEPEGDARREAHAVDFRFGAGVGVAARTALVAIHHVEAQRRGVAEALVQVGLDFAETIGTDTDADLVDTVEHGCLADLVDDATGLAATEQHRCRTAQHVDLLQVEDFAVVLRRIADTVEIHVTEGIETAQVHVVAGTTAFGCVEGQAGDVAQGLAQGVGFLLLDQRPRDGRDRLRHIVRVLHHLADTGLGGTVAVLLLRRGDGHRLQGLVVFGPGRTSNAEQRRGYGGSDRQQFAARNSLIRGKRGRRSLAPRIFDSFHKQTFYLSVGNGWLA